MLWSAYNGHLDFVKYLVGQGFDIYAQNMGRTTALMCSAVDGELACVKYLVEKGAYIDAKDKKGKTALMYSEEKNIKRLPLIYTSKGQNKLVKQNIFRHLRTAKK